VARAEAVPALAARVAREEAAGTTGVPSEVPTWARAGGSTRRRLRTTQQEATGLRPPLLERLGRKRKRPSSSSQSPPESRRATPEEVSRRRTQEDKSMRCCQIFSAEYWTPSTDWRADASLATGEDGDGYFPPPDTADPLAPAVLAGLLHACSSKQRDVRDFVYDAPENVCSEWLERAFPVDGASFARYTELAAFTSGERLHHYAHHLKTVITALVKENLSQRPAPRGGPVVLSCTTVSVALRRHLLQVSSLVRMVSRGEDKHGRRVCFVLLSGDPRRPWESASNAAGQLQSGLVFPSFLTPKVQHGFQAPFCLSRDAVYMPSVYSIHPTLRASATHLHCYARRLGVGLFSGEAQPLTPPTQRRVRHLLAQNRLPFLLGKAPGEAWPPHTWSAVPTPCCWYQLRRTKHLRFQQNQECTMMIENLEDLYSHSCADRNSKGGDIHDLKCQIGRVCDNADTETLSGIGHQTARRGADCSVDGERSTGTDLPLGPDLKQLLDELTGESSSDGEGEGDL
jgi:hypothetical protein